jgi:hypothetical protein
VRLLRTAIVALVLCALAATHVAAIAAPGGPSVTIGAIPSITGPYAPLGEPERNALEIVIDHNGVLAMLGSE